MTEIQRKLFELLCEVDDICRDNDVTYYLAAGCALGAVRHGGFLPWDDDIDVYITRDNWEKFKSVIYDNLPENRNFACEEHTEFYDNPIGRYVDRETTQMMKSQVISGECCGLFLEFFIMDPMPKGEAAKKEHKRYMRTYTELLSPYFQLSNHIFDSSQCFDYDLYCEYEKKAKTDGLDSVLEELKSKFACFPEEGTDEYCMRWGQRTYSFNAKHFGHPSYVTFEGREFPILNYPREYFRNVYGDDWMYIPTAVNQISHDLSKDIDRPYQEYVDMYMPLLDRQKAYNAYRERKEILMSCLVQKESLLLSYNKFKVSTITETIRENLPEVQVLEHYLESNDLSALNEELEFYYDRQFDPGILGNSLYIDLGDAVLSIALENLILQGSYFRAAKILNCRKKCSEKPFSERLQKVESHIDFCRSLSIATTDDNADPEMTRLLLENNPEYEHTLDYEKARLWLLRSGCKEESDFHYLIEQADQAIRSFGDNGELIWYRAWALHSLGDESAAAEYQKAVGHTRNGLVWHEAKELYGIEYCQVSENINEFEEEEEEEEEEDEENES